MRSLIAGNWKMHGAGGSLGEIAAVARWRSDNAPRAEVLICPPFTLISRAAEAAAGAVSIGGQDCHALISGAFTGEVSAEMLRDAGASAVIVGHSERRRYNGETDAMVAAKAEAAWRAGLLAIVCIGETEDEHDAGRAETVVSTQLLASLPARARASTAAIAYEPVWAIGSGRTPALGEIGRIHALIRTDLERRFGEDGAQMRILYGGSVKSENAEPILALPNVNGALVGGASLKADEFMKIVQLVPEN